jgi:hypothetical protein
MMSHPSKRDSGMNVIHHEVFRKKGAFAGWPANYGLWSWGDEVLTVFAVGSVGEKGEIHELDRHRSFQPQQARSSDGGRTWVSEPFEGRTPGGRSLSADEHLDGSRKMRPRVDRDADLQSINRPIDFLDPQTIVMCARTGLSEDSISWFYVSRSRGKRWEGPFAFCGLNLPLAARTDIVALGRHDALFMLTTSKTDGAEGRVFCARTSNGGMDFEIGAFVGEEPQGYRIMPSSVALPDGRILTAVRCSGKSSDRGWIELYSSGDHGRTWTPLGTAVENTGSGGNPAALLRLEDGSLVLVYGYRDVPFGIRMTVSADEGGTWICDKALRSDGGTPDLGYPRVVRVGDNRLLVVYYINDGEGEERYIAATKIDFGQIARSHNRREHTDIRSASGHDDSFNGCATG